jgi:hypothetical protein
MATGSQTRRARIIARNCEIIALCDAMTAQNRTVQRNDQLRAVFARIRQLARGANADCCQEFFPGEVAVDELPPAA